MFKKTIILSSALFSMLSMLSAQTFSIVVDPGSIKTSSGVDVDHTVQDAQGLYFFYAETTSSIAELQGLFENSQAPSASEFSSLSSLSWVALSQASFGISEFWSTAGYLNDEKITRESSDSRIIVGVFNVEVIDDVTVGSEVGLMASTSIIPDLGNIDYDFSSFEIVAGQSGSLQLVSVVPEPSAFASMAGFLALSFVMVRRRRA